MKILGRRVAIYFVNLLYCLDFKITYEKLELLDRYRARDKDFIRLFIC